VTSPQPTPDQQPTGLTGTEQAVVDVLTTALLEGALVAGTAIPLYLLLRLTSLGIDKRAARAAIRLGLTDPVRIPRDLRVRGTAASRVAAVEPAIRARYILNAAKRITDNLVHVGDQPHGLITAIRDERRYLAQHIDAAHNRRRAAQAVDAVARTSPFMIWQTAGDSRVEADCATLNGQLFTIADPPMAHGLPVLPGSVHPRCRCKALPFGASPIRALPTVTATR
jgi:hypothetical protein